MFFFNTQRKLFPLVLRTRSDVFLVTAAFLAVFLVSGCATQSKNSERTAQGIYPAPPEFYNPYYPAQTVTIDPGDVLTVRFYYHPELDSIQPVRPDGKISLTLFQGIDVAGMTPEELHDHLVQIYAREFIDPVIAVEIEKKSANTVFVTGQVAQGGLKALSSNLTIGQMLAQSDVKVRDADLGSVVLVRKHGDTDYKVYKLDARLENGSERDVYLSPGDIVVVPRNTITIIGDFIQKYIRDIIPPQMNIYYGLTTDLSDRSQFK
ncbi:hypothetical protein MASR1M90_07180 [Desulfovibrionales bacterium]